MTVSKTIPALLAATILASPTVADDVKPLRLLFWQAPTLLNPYLNPSFSDVASLALEPMAIYAPTGELMPVLAESIPTVENGGVAADFSSITWQLKEGLKWSDGSPVTSDDVVFTADYCMAEGSGCASAQLFAGIKSVEALDDRTVRLNFEGAKVFPYGALVSGNSPILQKAQFKDCIGDQAAQCSDANFMPIGTGPYVVSSFKPADVAEFTANPNYRTAGLPKTPQVIVKAGGDAAATGRAVLQTDEADYGWNLQLDPAVLKEMAAGGYGVVYSTEGSMVERLEVNRTDPSPDLPEGERSTPKHPHPFLTDLRVRKALSMAIDRGVLAEVGYGPAGSATCNLIPAPAVYASDYDGCLTADPEGAKALLDEAGWVDSDGDGIRDKDGRKLAILYQSSTNTVRQNVQSLVKQMWEDIGIEVTLRNVAGSVFFGSDPASPDTYQKFYADVEMYTNAFSGTDPEGYLGQYSCKNIPGPNTGWSGMNVARLCDDTYQALLDELAETGEAEARAALIKKANDYLVKDTLTLIPLIHRGMVSAHGHDIAGLVPNAWESDLWNIAEWHRID